MTTPLVSVIVPCFNLGEFLPETCESVRSQTYATWECIVVDDGSVDDTEQVARRYCEKDRRFRYLKKDNGGPSGARNTGMHAASGELFLPWDADDLFDPSYLDKAVRVLQSDSRVGFVSCYVEMFGAGRWIVRDHKSGGSENYVFWNNNVACALLRRKVWEDVGGYDETMREGYEDWDFWLSATEKGWLCHIIEEPLFKYRRRQSSRYNGSETKRAEFVKHIVAKHKEVFCAHVEEAVYQRERALIKQSLALDALQKSTEYRLGKALLHPWRALKRIAAVGRS